MTMYCYASLNRNYVSIFLCIICNCIDVHACTHSYMHITARRRKNHPGAKHLGLETWGLLNASMGLGRRVVKRLSSMQRGSLNPLLFRSCGPDIGALHVGTTKRLERC